MNVRDNLEEFTDPVNYDLEQAPLAQRRIAFYRDLAVQVGGPALELACGTGLVAIPMAELGLAVTGVDICAPMLAHARAKAEGQGRPIDWIEADVRDIDLGRRFRFVYLTGNAFQAFLTRADQDRLLASVRRHLAANGLFAFETRNPSGHDLVDEPEGAPEIEYVDVDDRFVALSSSQVWDASTQVMHWTTWRRWTEGGTPHARSSRIACRFTGADELATLLRDNGLEIVARYGGWDKSPVDARSESLVTLCRHLPDAEPGPDRRVVEP